MMNLAVDVNVLNRSRHQCSLYEGIQMGQAKTAFEEELRKKLPGEYTAVVSPWTPSGTAA